MNNARFEQLKSVVSNEPLLETKPSLEGLDPNVVESKGSIYYGTGLCTPKYLSVGLPFDVLAMILVAEKIRRQLEFSKIFHHIADTHAKSNEFCESAEVDRIAQLVLDTLQKIFVYLDFKTFRPMLSSEFDSTPTYQEILDGIPDVGHEYVRRELADIEYYRRTKEVSLKIGWIVQAGEAPVGYDERLYDRQYREKVVSTISFLYLKAGRTFNPTRPKVSPYISIPDERRIILQRGEDVRGKFAEAEKDFVGDKSFGGAKKYLSSIVRLHDKLILGPEERQKVYRIPLEERIQSIIDSIFEE